jgi:aldehyde dehydrogenase (NAD+)
VKSYDRLFIGGNWSAPAGTGTIEVINPTTEEVCGTVPEATEADVDAAVAAAREAFDNGPWPHMTPAERALVVTKVSEAIKGELEPMAQLISTEMGSPIGWGMMAQVLAPAMIFDYYIGLASTYGTFHSSWRLPSSRRL